MGIESYSQCFSEEKTVKVDPVVSKQNEANKMKEVLEIKVLPWDKKITKKSGYPFQQNGARAHLAKTAKMSLWHSISAGRILSHSNTDELKVYVNREWRSKRKGFVRKVCKDLD